jgi:hypothetical protein
LNDARGIRELVKGACLMVRSLTLSGGRSGQDGLVQASWR